MTLHTALSILSIVCAIGAVAIFVAVRRMGRGN